MKLKYYKEKLFVDEMTVNEIKSNIGVVDRNAMNIVQRAIKISQKEQENKSKSEDFMEKNLLNIESISFMKKTSYYLIYRLTIYNESYKRNLHTFYSWCSCSSFI
jgi:hypothetical protein